MVSARSPDALLVLFGIAGPPLLALVIVAAGLLYPGYDHATQYISELGAAGSPVAGLTNAGFVLFGLCIALFGVGLFRVPAFGASGKSAALLVILTGLAIAAVGLFPCDVGCEAVSATGELHTLAGIASFAFLFLAYVLLFVQVAVSRDLRFLRPFLVAIPVMGIVAGFALSHYFLLATPPVGIYQRIAVGLPFLVLAALAVRIHQTAPRQQ